MVYDFTENDFLNLCLNHIHHSNPSHWIRSFHFLGHVGIIRHLRNQLIQHPLCCFICIGTVKYYAQIHLQVWQNSVCTGQGNLPLIT